MATNTGHNYLKWIVTLVLLGVVISQVYLGVFVEMIGIPGLLEIRFTAPSISSSGDEGIPHVDPLGDEETSSIDLSTSLSGDEAAPGTNHLPKSNMVFVREHEIFTNSSNVVLLRGDHEINSDDWTSVELEYFVNIINETKIELTLKWHAQERNKDRSSGNTRFKSSRTFTLFNVNIMHPGSRIEKIIGLELKARNERYYSGKLRGFLPFPDTGSMRNIRVQIDEKGRYDNQIQELQAKLPEFSVQLVTSN